MGIRSHDLMYKHMCM